MNEIKYFGDYTFEATQMVVMRGIDIIDIPHRQKEALALLLRAHGKVVGREAFLDTVWKDVVVEEHNLTQTIFLLRKALGKLPSGQEYIETVPKKGYRICSEALQPNLFHTAPSEAPPLVWNGPERRRIWNGPERRLLNVTTPPRSKIRSMSDPLSLGIVITVVAVTALILGHFVGRAHSQSLRLIAVKKLTRDGYLKAGESPIVPYQGSLLFTEIRNKWPYLVSVPITGGSAISAKLPTSGSYLFGVHPERQEVLLSAPDRDALIGVATLQGQTLLSNQSVSGHDPSWSPDGTQMVYVDQGQVILANSAGQNPVVLASFPGIPFWTAWSPDGKVIRFSVREAAGQQSLYEIDLATRSLTPLLKGDRNEHKACCGSWSRNGEYFVYVVENARSSTIWGRSEKLLRWNRGGASWEIAAGPVDFWRAPVLSEDMHHLYAIGEQRRLHLTLLNHNFEPFLRDVSVGALSVSHDGKWIVYTLYPEGTLWKSRFDGTSRVQLTEPGEFARSPQWSADDRSIIYVREWDGKRTIASINVETGVKAPQITNVRDTHQIAYAPTAEKIAFARQLGTSQPSDAIFILTLLDKKVEAIPASSGLSLGKWSPDARYLSAVSNDQSRLKLLDLQTQSWQDIASASSIGAQAWDREKNVLYYVAERNGKYALMKYSIATGRPEEVRQMPEQYDEDYASSVLETTPSGDILFGYSLRETELYDITMDW
jgi:Tol biopolymer transport system component/DNA-binding winged helix-turn-helix (wHTH) protein